VDRAHHRARINSLGEGRRRNPWRVGVLFFCFAILVLSATAGAQNVDYGDAYHAIDRAAVYVTTWFDDAKITSIRRDHGSIETIIEDATAKVLARSVYRAGALDSTLIGLGQLVQYSATLSSTSSYSTDWFNKQLYVLWRDQNEANHTPGMAGRSLPLTWHRGHLRLQDEINRERVLGMPDPVDAKPRALRTQFRGFHAYSERNLYPKRKKGIAYAAYTTRFYDDSGNQLGLMRYYEKPRAVSWSFTNGQEGVAPEWRVPGGYKFDLNMAWASVQAMAFQQSRSPDGTKVIKNKKLVDASPWARFKTGLGRAIDAAWQFVSPTLYAQSKPSCDGLSDGCTGLHWLDGSLFQDCCDQHDVCFEADCTSPCTKWSWLWPFGQWDCAACNAQAVACFFTTAITGDFGHDVPDITPESCRDGDPCSRCFASDWCPAECQTCDGIGDDGGGPPI
jgi:hypothetical protein